MDVPNYVKMNEKNDKIAQKHFIPRTQHSIDI